MKQKELLSIASEATAFTSAKHEALGLAAWQPVGFAGQRGTQSSWRRGWEHHQHDITMT